MRLLLSLFLIFLLRQSAEGDEAVMSMDGTEGSSAPHVDLFKGCTHYDLQQEGYLQPGQHLVCAVSNPETGGLLVSIIKDSELGSEMFFEYKYEANTDIEDLFTHLHELVGTSNKRPASKWKMFTLDGGEAIGSLDNLVYHGESIIYTNGNFIWPGVAVGYKRSTPEGYDVETLSLRPLVLRVANFLTFEECDYIRSQSEPNMAASGTSKMDHDRDKPDTTWRTSTQYFLPSAHRPIIQAIDKRTAALTKTQVNQQEYVQVLRYLEGQKYDQHHDYFDAKFYQKDLETLRNIKHGEKNRLATVLWYLTTVEEGGHTIFPLANGNKFGHDHDFTDCSLPGALKVQPVKGEVIVFYSLTADGGMDVSSLHGACPVGKGGDINMKWAANKWIWSEAAGFLS